MNKTTLLLSMLCIIGSQLIAQQKGEQKPASLSTISLENLIQQKSSNYVITSEHISRISGIHHIYLRQAINGIEVYGTESDLHLGKSGNVVASHSKFLDNIQATVNNSSASLSAEQAISKVAQQMGYPLKNLQQLESLGGVNKKAVYNKAGISTENIPVKLMYYYKEGRGTFMVWELSIQETTSSDWWNFRVDANSGIIIDKDNWTVSCDIEGNHEEHIHGNKVVYGPQLETNYAENTPASIYTVPEEAALLVGNYRVYAMPIESPNYGGRTLVANPDNPLASPFGWHDTNGVAGAEFTRSQGNNTEAYDDDNANNLPDGKWAEGGGTHLFDFPLNTTYSAGNQSEAAAITNLFYWANIIHDLAYQYGFDEVSGNFQENNYGNGGLGSDYVYSEAQDGSGTCNANFGTPVDGQNPRMQMYVCNTRDGDLDNVVIIHEYTHGISNRLTGGPGNVNCLNNAEQMGEGWGDWLGLMMTMETGDAGTDSRGVGTWLIGEGAGGPGIREYPYSTDMSVNLHTYDDIKTVAVPHGVGSVWAEMLWEMAWGIIAVEGFDTDFYTGTGGNNIAMALVFEGMKLQPCSPGFVDGRDAILAADQALYGGAYQCIIWEAFAKRGLGFSASQGSSGSRSDGTEAFDLPPTFASFNAIDTICLSDGIQTGLSGGLPAGGVYGGLGVTDDGNGTTFTFDPSIPGAGTATVTYSVTDFCSGLPVVINDTIEITNDPPVIICRGSGILPTIVTETSTTVVAIPDNNPTGVTSIIAVPDNFTIADLDVNLGINHTWVGDVRITLQSPAGTVVTIFDRPGVPASTFGCSGDNILATLDDEAGSPVETQCAGSVPTINGTFTPNNPLSAFDGQSTLGNWTLTVSDLVGGDAGAVNTWGITYTHNVVLAPLDVFLDGGGNATVNAEDLLYSITVDCGGYTVLAGTPPAATVSFDTSDIGLNNVDVIVTNDNGASSTCTAIVNVIGSVSGITITCPADITISNDPGICGAVVNFANATATDVEDGALATTQITGPASGSVFPAGVTLIEFSATDSDGNTETCSFNITVNDTEDPQITCPGDITQPNDPGDPGAIVNYVVSASDNCPGETLNQTAGLPSGSLFPIGTTTNTFEVTDASGNTATCSFDITITTTSTVPVITCPANINVNNDLGICGAVVTFANATATDAEDGPLATMQITGPTSGSVFPVGVTLIEFSATDSDGNTVTCSFNITVNDTEDPTFSGGSPVVDQQALANNTCMATFNQTDLAQSFIPSMNSMSGASIFLSNWGAGSGDVTIALYDNLPNAAGNLLAFGTAIGVSDNQWADATWTSVPVTPGNTYYIVFTSTNGGQCVSGDTNNGYPNGMVFANGGYQAFPGFDYTFKTFSGGGGGSGCPADITQGNDAGICGAVVNYTAPMGTDNCPGAVTTQTAGLPSGSVFLEGTTTNTFVVTDASGNTATCSFDVTINDTEDPQITCPGDITQGNDAGLCGAVINYTVGSTDNCSGQAVTQTAGLPSGSVFPVGTTTNTFLVTDASGNTATCSFDVTINDTEDPQITCPGDITQGNDAGLCGAIVTYTVGSTDNCSGQAVTQTAGLPSGSVFPVGATTNTFLVTDASGNTATCSFDVTVNDTEDPQITCPGDITQGNDAGLCSAVVTYTVGSTDNCSGQVVTQTAGLPSGSVFPVGTTTNTFLVTDASGNTATCSFDVIVNDTEAPIVACPADVIANTDAGMCSAMIVYPPPLAIDNCGVSTIVQVAGLPSGSDFPVGTTTNTFLITDINGNITTCSFDVIISDDDAPVFNCPADIVQSNDPGVCEAVVNYTITAIDNCSGGTLIQTAGLPSGSVFPLGITTNTFVATDGVGNSSTCTFTVTIIDTEAPVLVCQADVTVDNDPGMCSAVVVFPFPVVTDNCTVFGNGDIAGFTALGVFNGKNYYISDDPFIPSDAFPDAVSNGGLVVTINDAAENTFIRDAVNAILTDERILIGLNDVATEGTFVWPSGEPVSYTNWSAGEPNNNGDEDYVEVFANGLWNDQANSPARRYILEVIGSGTIIQTAGLPSGSEFPVGTTTNTFEATDAFGNTSTCSFDVTVNDTEDPVFTGGAPVVDQQALANNTCMATFNQTDLAQSFIPSMNSMSGASIFLSDWGAGSGDVTIALYDNLPNAGGTLLASGTAIGVSDNQWADVTWSSVPVTPGNTYYIVFTSTNGGQCVSGDTNNGYPNGMVFANAGYQPFPGFDYTFKTFSGGGGGCPANITQGNDPGTCDAVVNYTAPVGEDNCAGAVTVQIAGLPSGSVFPVGTTTNTFEVTDASGNTATCSFDVIVNDTEAPVITCPADLTVEVNEGELYTLPDYFDSGEATATDNCTDPVVITSQNPAAGTQLGGGVHTITLTATDDSGNVSTCTFEVTVEIILGVADNQDLGTIKMYPNPASTTVIIGNPRLIRIDNISIYDLNGRLIMEVNHPLGAETTINVSNLSAAVYMVRIVAENGQIVKQLVKE